MATAFLAIGSSLGLGGAAAGAGATAGAAAGAAGLAGGISTISQILSAGSALAAIGQGFAASNRLKGEAALANAEATQEEAAGAARARDLAREYAELRSEQGVIQAANGLNTDIGTPENVARSTAKMAERNLSVTRSNTRNRTRIARLRARGLNSEAGAALFKGFGSAGSIALDSFQLTG